MRRYSLIGSWHDTEGSCLDFRDTHYTVGGKDDDWVRQRSQILSVREELACRRLRWFCRMLQKEAELGSVAALCYLCF